MAQGERRLAAIMFTDLVGFTALGQKNESLALSVLDIQRNLCRPIFKKHKGREVKTIGDAFLVDFPSALNAVRCAYEIQRTSHETNRSMPEENRVHLRIGVHLGDVVDSEGDISGDAVNVASRIESLAEDGGVCLTRQVFDHVQNKFELPLESLGQKSLKNLRTPIEVYKIVMPWDASASEMAELEKNRVAVLPLKNMSPDPNDEYFADGMTEELITALSGVRELTVIARTSVMPYKTSPKRITEVGRELNTGTIIEGSVRKAANKVRITVQMIDARTEGHLWTQTYDRQLDDIFAIQSEIAEKVAGELKVKLLASERDRLEKKPTENTEAYTLLLKGRYYWNERNKFSVERGVSYLEKAVEADPNLALAYSELADAHVIMADYGMMPIAEAHAKVREYSSKALELDSTLSQPHAALAVILERNFQWAEAETEFKLAIQMNPNNTMARHWYSLDQMFQRKWQTAIQSWRKAKEIDPLSLIIGSAFGFALVRTGQRREGLDMQRTVLEMNDSFVVAHRNMGLSYIIAGMVPEASQEARKLYGMSKEPVNAGFAASILAMAGETKEANAIADGILERSHSEYTDPFVLATAYAGLRDRSKTLDWLEKAVSQKTGGVIYVDVTPSFDWLRKDPEYENLLRRMGIGLSTD